MCNLLKSIIYRLWVLIALFITFSVLIFWFYGFMFTLGLFALLIPGALYFAQDLLLYYPYEPLNSRQLVFLPGSYKLPYENVRIKNKDGIKLHMYLIKQFTGSEHRPSIIFFHGNSGNIGHRLPNVTEMFHKLNVNILIVEYRGYGFSEGTPSENGLYVDAECALNFMLQRPDIDHNKIILFGRSLGGAVVVDLASKLQYKNRIWAIIVENTFTSIPDMAKVLFKWKCLKYLPNICHKNKYLSLEKIGLVTTPTLVICGSNDELVPPSMAKELYERCGAICKKLAIMEKGGHSDTWTCQNYYNVIQQFIDGLPVLNIDKEMTALIRIV